MKLLLIITDYGSFNNFLSEVAVEMVNLGHDVNVICSSLKVIDYEDKYPYERLGIKFYYRSLPRTFNLLSQLKASRIINRTISSINPDLIHIHFTTGIFTTVLWRKPAYFVMGTIHGIGYPTIKTKRKRKIFERVEKFCFKRLDQIYLINSFDYKLVKKLYPEKAFKYNSFGVGCDLDKYDATMFSVDQKQALRNKLSIQEHDLVLAYTGRFVTFKGFDLLIRAMMDIVELQRYPDIKLVLIGGNDAAHKNGLSKVEDDFLKTSSQIVTTGFTADVNSFLAISDLFVFPSVKEGMPVCIMEALAMGLPVITSNTRGCNDLVIDGFNGLLLSSNPSVAEVKEAIIKMYDNRQRLKVLSVNAGSNRQELSRKKYVEDQISIYKNYNA